MAAPKGYKIRLATVDDTAIIDFNIKHAKEIEDKDLNRELASEGFKNLCLNP